MPDSERKGILGIFEIYGVSCLQLISSSLLRGFAKSRVLWLSMAYLGSNMLMANMKNVDSIRETITYDLSL